MLMVKNVHLPDCHWLAGHCNLDAAVSLWGKDSFLKYYLHKLLAPFTFSRFSWFLLFLSNPVSLVMFPTPLVRFVLWRVKDAWIFGCNMKLRHIYCQEVCFRSVRIPSERLSVRLSTHSCLTVSPVNGFSSNLILGHFAKIFGTFQFFKSKSMNKILREDLLAFFCTHIENNSHILR
jgi:hypothetical protein